MKTKIKISLKQLVAIFFALVFTNGVNAQIDLNKIKNKVKNKTNQDQNENNAKTNDNKNQNVTNEDFKGMRSYYESKTEVCKSWPNTVFSSYDFKPLIPEIKNLDMPNFEKEMESHKAKYKDIFLFYDLGEIPNGMQKAPNTRKPWETDDDRYWINDAAVKYYKWKAKVAEQRQDLAQLANNYINNAETAQQSEKLEKAMLAIEVVQAIKSIQPDNSQISDLEKRAYQVQDKCFDDVRHLMTGEMHKTNFKKIVGFTKQPIVGKEDKTTVSNEISPGKPFYLVAYFSNKISELDLKGHINGIPTSKTPIMEWKQVGTDNNYGRMQMYWNEEMMKTVREQSYFVFDMFPDINTVNYKSHVEYIPVMNFVKWLTYQMPGKYQFYIQFSTGAAVSTLADNTFTINLTQEAISELKIYYNKLSQKKLQAVTFNQSAGCNDKKTTIGKKDDMNKYGELIKLSCKETGKVMQPWLKEHLVEYFTGAGYGVFKQTDGKYEIIKLTFRKAPTEKIFSFYGAEIMSHYEIEGSTAIKSEIMKYGYEITKEGIDKCTIW